MRAPETDLPATVPADPVDLDEPKGHVLHTRVPPSLDRHIKRRARSLGMSVSTVVRNVLLTTFGLVEDIVTDSTNIALAITGAETTDRGRSRGSAAEKGPPATDVVAWQEAVLNVNAVCQQCNAILRRGARAAIGARSRPGPQVVLCRRCLARLEEPRAARRARRRG
jgi:hypothetical protein